MTSASTGFGRFLTELGLSKGDTVVATLRKPEVLSELSDKHLPDRLLLLKLGTRSEITAAFAETYRRFARIDAGRDCQCLTVRDLACLPRSRAQHNRRGGTQDL
ncbi:hypothetical protein NM688_g3595 [Phlebia brevispora]|uniref:Uncharacterized protein n=1 Tax=Phlebia brevispora TaxID=194682 RepID=A0ACC1T530_9APHY|nr:hypothetical protein NM688_g3595 [Phlebia brevispora]